jgi:hypothetical protein
MKNCYLIYRRDTDLTERFWTGKLGHQGELRLTDDINLARQFTTAREAYEFAGSRVRLCRSVQLLHVGRRPEPTYVH